MHRRLLSLLVPILMLVVVGTTAAAVHEGYALIDRLDADREAGTLSADEALLYKFYYVFEHDKLPADYRPAGFPPLKCATPLVQEYEQLRDSLGKSTIDEIEAFLAPKGGAKATYVSPSGIFNLTYETTGDDAVPAEDTDPANGVPDFVEKCALYMDHSWDVEINDAGFPAPTYSSYYQIDFEDMTAYGYTSPTSTTRSRITLHNTFTGFPPNDDPEGDVWGAAKVTCAHEFKHASQRAGSYWSEGGWVEVDAVWTEDLVYDYVNDYYNYLSSDCGITSPQLPLNDGGSGTYEDCIWQLWMSETYGNDIIVDFWNYRRSNSGENVLTSYDTILDAYGSSLEEGIALFGGFNSVCNTRAIAGIGYEEAADYPLPALGYFGSYPHTITGTLDHLSSRLLLYLFFTPGEPGVLHLSFDGDDIATMGLVAVVKKNDDSGVFEPIPLDGDTDAEWDVSVPLGEMYSCAIAITNTTTNMNGRPWSLTVSKEIPPDPVVDLSAATLEMELDIDDSGTEGLTITNLGLAGSTLDYDVVLSDVPNPLKAYAPLSWLSVDIDNGSLGSGDDDLLTLTFDATGLVEDVYTGYVVIESNAPSTPDVVTATLTVNDPGTDVGDSPHVFAMKGNHPNPFNPSTRVDFVLADAGLATVDVLDLQGRVVKTLHAGPLGAGPASVVWDGTDDDGRVVSSGTYLARVRAGGGSATHKMTLAK